MPENKRQPGGFVPEIIEVGIVAVVHDEVIDTFSSYVKPQKVSYFDRTVQKKFF
ncbi:hypothetical protein GCM10020331_029370 [Ectobacillus funiculus]